MNAKRLLESYLEEEGLNQINSIMSLKMWIENKINTPMSYNLIVARGKGGGQAYKVMFPAVDPEANNNKQCVYYSEVDKAILYMRRNGHISLDEWLKKHTS